MLDRDGAGVAGAKIGDGIDGRSLDRGGRGHADGAGDRHAGMGEVGHEITRGEASPRLGRRHDDEFRDDARRGVPHAHPRRRLDADGLETGEEILIGVELGLALVSGLAEIACPGDDAGHADIDAGDRDAIDVIESVARRQELAGLGARGIDEGKLDRRRRPRHPVDLGVALIGHLSARRLHDGLDQGVDIDEVNSDGGFGIGSPHQALLDDERPDAGQHVAAGRSGIDERPVDHHLGEEIIDIGVIAPAR